MKLYSVDVDVTARLTIEVSASDEDGAIEIVEGLNLDDIERKDFTELQSIEVVGVEEITNVD